MKKVIAKEFLWFIVTIFLAIPLALVFLWMLGYTTEKVSFAESEKNYLLAIYLVGYFISFIGIYLVRFIVMAIQVLVHPDEEAP